MKTLALVIGNNEYYEGAKLTNAINDAVSINQVFERLGFDIIFKCDCNANDYSELLADFESRIQNYDASLFYFAGHGFELDGENYLAAIDCQIPPPNKYHAKQNCIRLNEILDIHRKNADKVNIVIIDACRRAFERSGNISLAPMFAPKGTLIAFSTSPNEGASDAGFEGNSLYTGALLKYIGREHISVEELFKKVRKTVFALSEGRQTTWEHTSLINDYYFNTGQLVHSLSIPYDENVVKDVNYKGNGSFGELIMALKTYNWDIQNPAIDKLIKIPAKDLDKNQQFILGRNLLQASGAARSAVRFMESIHSNIIKYNNNPENHLLNGILFEIYFNSYAEFRIEKMKTHFLKEILALRKVESLNRSFEFIRNLIENTGYQLIYLPKSQDEIIDIDVVASTDTVSNFLGENVTYQVISSITYSGIDITKRIAYYGVTGRNENGLKQAIQNLFAAPDELIQINSNIALNKIAFIKSITEEGDKW
ncbi:MAG: caspase family protein [Bacteroidetes bacterium]|nr:caspase family protein [Bacteroidota bacterium]